MIAFDYNRAYQQAKEIELIADDIDRLIKGDLSSTEQALSAAWTGGAATLFTQNILQFREDATTESRKLRDIAAKIRQTAKEMEKTDKETKQALQQLDR